MMGGMSMATKDEEPSKEPSPKKKKANGKKNVDKRKEERRTEEAEKGNEENQNQNLADFLLMQKYLRSVLRHIGLVQDACKLLGEKFIEKGEVDFGRILIANGFKHDNSKLYGIEWEYLNTESDPEKLRLAHHQHVTTNPHHPEYWGGVEQMPRICVAEMVCDLFARSTEFGTDLREWIKTEFVKKHSLSPNGKCYRAIKEFVDMLLDKPFSQMK